MEVTFKKDGSTLIAEPIGKIDSLNAMDLQETIQSKIEDDVTELKIDMSKVDYISSKGVRILLLLHRYMLPRGKMVLCHLNNSVQEVLRLSALLKTFEIE